MKRSLSLGVILSILLLSVVTATALQKVTIYEDHDVYVVKFARIAEDDGALVAAGKDMTGYVVEMLSARSDVVVSIAIIGPDGTAEFTNNGPRESRERFYYRVTGKRWAIPCEGPFKVTQSKGLGKVRRDMQVNERLHGDEFLRTDDPRQPVKPVPDGFPWYQMDSSFFHKAGRKVKIVPGTVTVEVTCDGESFPVITAPVSPAPAVKSLETPAPAQVATPVSVAPAAPPAVQTVTPVTWREKCQKLLAEGKCNCADITGPGKAKSVRGKNKGKGKRKTVTLPECTDDRCVN